PRAAPPDRDGQRHGRVVVAPRDVAPRIDHHHQRRSDRDRRETRRRRLRLEGYHADREDQEEGPDELDDVLPDIHDIPLPSDGRNLARKTPRDASIAGIRVETREGRLTGLMELCTLKG